MSRGRKVVGRGVVGMKGMDVVTVSHLVVVVAAASKSSPPSPPLTPPVVGRVITTLTPHANATSTLGHPPGEAEGRETGAGVVMIMAGVLVMTASTLVTVPDAMEMIVVGAVAVTVEAAVTRVPTPRCQRA